MPKNRKSLTLITSIMICFILGFSACAPDVACPTGHQDAKKLFSGAENGKGTEKERTSNGLIKKKNSNLKRKKQ